uniref:uncharacterized protein n=1 Tax=Semicossyphus pulcher TaxID=241346 RepID=UPI0037E7D744
MSAATASIADVSRTNFINKDDRRNRSSSGQAQCTPMPLPAVGTRRIIKGNGTNVGTVISLLCPAKHKLVGELTCVPGPNSTQWVGETYCKPLARFEDYGFRVAVVASIVSSAIILLMSMAFLTCCLLDCIKDDKKKKQESDPDMWQWDEQAQQQEEHGSRNSHKGRNNNNNNTQEKLLSLWDSGNPARCDDMRACRYQQQYTYGPACTCGPTPLLSALPGCDYDQPLLPRNQESTQNSAAPLHYFRSPHSSFHSASQGLDLIPAVGPGFAWQYGGQQASLSGGNPPSTDVSNSRNIKKESSIRIISV